ncbi:MAG: hypothetical protein M1497_03480 [Nitrospirae bacterium]|nr:hypothetical protein [Nitrospirota bacterium]
MSALLLDIDFRGVYEDNITASAADIGRKGDFYTILSASGGGYTEVGQGTYLFIRGDAAGYLYRKNSDLNAVIIGARAGIHRKFSDVVSAEVALGGARKEYKETGRSSSALGGSFEVRQQLTSRFWIKEGYAYENNNASSDIFSYQGHLLGLWTGYLVAPKTMINLGYSYLYRKYEEPADFRNRFHTISAAIAREVARKVYAYAGYSRQYNGSNIPDTANTNNIYTLGISYSY